jgi:hypothetical protein
MARVEDRIGIKPDSVLRVHLSAKELTEATPRQTWNLVDGRGSRLRRSAKAQGVERRRPEIRRRIKRFPSLDQALKAPLRYAEYPVLGRSEPSFWISGFFRKHRQTAVNVSRCTLATHAIRPIRRSA